MFWVSDGWVAVTTGDLNLYEAGRYAQYAMQDLTTASDPEFEALIWPTRDQGLMN